ncbi:MAG: redoxin domain-containing protein, partial [Candidatus Dojkabacteria bacterium]
VKDEILNLGVSLYGINWDDKESHDEFKQKHGIELELVTDHSGEITKSLELNTEIELNGEIIPTIKRTTLLVSNTGQILKLWSDVQPDSHIDEVLEYLKENKSIYQS